MSNPVRFPLAFPHLTGGQLDEGSSDRARPATDWPVFRPHGTPRYPIRCHVRRPGAVCNGQYIIESIDELLYEQGDKDMARQLLRAFDPNLEDEAQRLDIWFLGFEVKCLSSGHTHPDFGRTGLVSFCELVIAGSHPAGLIQARGGGFVPLWQWYWRPAVPNAAEILRWEAARAA